MKQFPENRELFFLESCESEPKMSLKTGPICHKKYIFFWITVHFSAFGQNFLIISLEILQRICYFAANLTNTLEITNCV